MIVPCPKCGQRYCLCDPAPRKVSDEEFRKALKPKDGLEKLISEYTIFDKGSNTDVTIRALRLLAEKIERLEDWKKDMEGATYLFSQVSVKKEEK